MQLDISFLYHLMSLEQSHIIFFSTVFYFSYFFSIATGVDMCLPSSLFQVKSDVNVCRWYFLELNLDFFNKSASPLLVKDFKPALNRDCSIRIKKVKDPISITWHGYTKHNLLTNWFIWKSRFFLLMGSKKLAYIRSISKTQQIIVLTFYDFRSTRFKKANGSVRLSSFTPQRCWWRSLLSSESLQVSYEEFGEWETGTAT